MAAFSMPEAVPICIIDTNPSFAEHLSKTLSQRLKSQVFGTETYAGIPLDGDLKGPLPKVVIFDPELDDFRRVSEAILKLRELFGSKAFLVAHSDTWQVPFNNLRMELRDAGIRLGLKRHDYDGAIELISLVSSRASMDDLVKRFAT
jgi:hypothetical protein